MVKDPLHQGKAWLTYLGARFAITVKRMIHTFLALAGSAIHSSSHLEAFKMLKKSPCLRPGNELAKIFETHTAIICLTFTVEMCY
jgi:hypothetical protein